MNRYEDLLLGQAGARVGGGPRSLIQLAAAASTARSQNPSLTGSDRLLYELGTSLVGPIFFLFTAWVLRQAAELGIERLHFIARGGQVLHEIASSLGPRSGVVVDLRYLHASRQSTRLAALGQVDADALDWILAETPELTLRMVGHRTALDPAAVASVFARRSGAATDLDQPLDPPAIALLAEVIAAPPLAPLIVANAERDRRLALRYFKQEGLFDHQAQALVDLGWRGSIQTSIEGMLARSGSPRWLRGLYFGVVADGAVTAASERTGYYFAPAHRLHAKCPVDWTGMRLLEIFAAGDHGLTLDYRGDDRAGRVRPRLREADNADARRWGLAHLRAGIRTFVATLPDALVRRLRDDQDAEHLQAITALLGAIVHAPSVDEIAAVGAYPFKSDQAETYARPFALDWPAQPPEGASS